MNVPKLRFSEFNGEWKETALKKLLLFKNGINASKESYGKGTKFINVLDILNNDFITYDKIIGSVKVSKEELNNYSVSYGDVLFQRSSETREEVGTSNVYLDRDKKSVFGGFVIRGKKIGEYNPFFLKELLKCSSVRREITSRSGGSTRYNIGQKSLEKVNINLPSIPEQEKIASFLSKVDLKIKKLEKKQELWKVYKKDMMHQIFSQELRFKAANGDNFPDWGDITFGEIFKYGKAGGTPTSTERKYYGGNIPFLSISDMTSQGKYISSATKQLTNDGLENSSAWIVPKNSLLYSIYASVGSVAINKVDISTSQAIFGIVLKENISNLEYVYYYLLDYKKYINRFIETGTQGNLNAKTVRNLIIKLPKTQEQEKIANFLSDIDCKIELLYKVLMINKEFKKGLLQQMFVN